MTSHENVAIAQSRAAAPSRSGAGRLGEQADHRVAQLVDVAVGEHETASPGRHRSGSPPASETTTGTPRRLRFERRQAQRFRKRRRHDG